ncbi:hypothetical protein SMC26_39465 [Actinomadura fulvescens]|uniref:Uncharacterized protein n=1 Tax=Actinomadura fulvescens TaxID=46160 RepID=A0ABN3PZR8_9ACTN
MAFDPWTAITRVTASRLNGMTPKFKNWVPTWTTQTGNFLPSYGNADVNCRWAQSGDMVVATFNLTCGTTTNIGGGGGADNFWWGLPVPAAVGGAALGFFYVFPSTNSVVPCLARSTADTSLFYLLVAGNWPTNQSNPSTGIIDAFTPIQWGAGTEVRGTLMYEAQ